MRFFPPTNNNLKNTGLIFYCKDCEKVVDVIPVGRKFVYKCAICKTKNVAFGTEKSIRNFFHVEEDKTAPVVAPVATAAATATTVAPVATAAAAPAVTTAPVKPTSDKKPVPATSSVAPTHKAENAPHPQSQPNPQSSQPPSQVNPIPENK